MTEIGEGAFSGLRNLSRITLTPQVKRIGKRAFSGCSSLCEIDFPEGCRLENASFVLEGCRHLERVKLPENIRELPQGFVFSCTELKEVTLPEGLQKIGKDAFSGCTSLTGISVPDSVTVIGENAFRYCSSLKTIICGKGIVQTGAYAFDACAQDADIVWLAGDKWRSVWGRPFPEVSRIASIAAPALAAEQQPDVLQVLLACGFILHPELEEEYSSGQREFFREWIPDALSSCFNDLTQKHILYPVFVRCLERGLIRPDESEDLFRDFLLRVRTLPLSHDEKKKIDHITAEAGLAEPGSYESEQEEKKLLRRIRLEMSEEERKKLLVKAGIGTLLPVPNRKTGKAMPDEVVSYVIASYLKEWKPMDSLPSNLHFCREADRLAAEMEPESLQALLRKILCVEISSGAGGTKREVLYPERMLPVFRFADRILTEELFIREEKWSDYSLFGQSGYQAIQVRNRAMILNDTDAARKAVCREGISDDYASLRGISADDFLSKEAESGNQDAEQELRKRIQDKIRKMIRSGEKQLFSEWKMWTQKNRFTRKAAESVLWCGILPENLQIGQGSRQEIKQDAEQEEAYYFRLAGGKLLDAEGRILQRLPEAVKAAHPVEMNDGEFRRWRRCFSGNGIRQDVKQLCLPGSVRTRETGAGNAGSGFYEDSVLKERYDGLAVSMTSLRRLSREDFYMSGSPSSGIRVFFNGKLLCEAKSEQKPAMNRVNPQELPKGKKQIESDAEKVELAGLREAHFTVREEDEILFCLDRAFAYELIRAGRISAAPFLQSFSLLQLGELLEASIRNGNHENTALLIHAVRQEKLEKAGAEGLLACEDEELDW